jgi:hypothetical protein
MTKQRRTTVIVVGAVLALAGLGLAGPGGLLLAVFGGDGTVASGTHQVGTERAALVSSVAEINDVADLADVVGDPRLEVSATGPGVFVGIGPAAEVDRYLASAPVDEVTDFEVDPFRQVRKPHPGSSRPAPPASQRFWLAQSDGADASLDWKIRDGDYRLVVMNADGSRGVDAEAEFKLHLPHVAAIAWGLFGIGLLLLAGGIAAIAVKR